MRSISPCILVLVLAVLALVFMSSNSPFAYGICASGNAITPRNVTANNGSCDSVVLTQNMSSVQLSGCPNSFGGTGPCCAFKVTIDVKVTTSCCAHWYRECPPECTPEPGDICGPMSVFSTYTVAVDCTVGSSPKITLTACTCCYCCSGREVYKGTMSCN